MPRRAIATVFVVLACLLAAGAGSASADPLQRQLDGVLAKVVGPGKGFVVVSENANLDRTTLAKLRYGRTGVALAGASATMASPSGTASARTTQWANDQTITQTAVAPGAVKRMSVALVLDRSIPAKTARRIARAIGVAAGLQRARGDRLTLLRTKLPPQPAARSTATAAPWRTLLQPAALAAVVVMFMAFMAWTITRHRRPAVVTGR